MTMKQEFFSWLRSIGYGLSVALICIIMLPAVVLAAPVAVILGFLGVLDIKKDTPTK